MTGSLLLLFTFFCTFFNALHAGLSPKASQCQINPDNGGEWPDEPPILTSVDGDLLLPEGTEDNRWFEMGVNQVVMLGCPGSSFSSSGLGEGPVFASCQGGTDFLVWEEGNEGNSWEVNGFGTLGCDDQPEDTTSVVGPCGPYSEGIEIKIEFDVTSSLETEAVTITVCHDLQQSRTLWSRHTIWDEVAAQDHGNDRPSFSPDDFFDYDVNYYYKTATQRETISDLVGSDALGDQYVQGQKFLSRGHLAPNADFIFYSWMDSTFHFINVAPQWQSFNGANWNSFESSCRSFAEERELDLVVYTGTNGVTQLEDVNGKMVDIFLYQGNKLPVPRFYWKILYDPLTMKGVAMVGINNPHLSPVPDDYIVCPTLSSHPLLPSNHEDIYKGFMYACRVEDLAAAFPEVPSLPSMELLE